MYKHLNPEIPLNKQIRNIKVVHPSFLPLIIVAVRRWQINYYSRKALLQLDQHQLNDIGISDSQAMKEGRKPFWVK